MAVEEAYELAYREAVRALDHQFALLTELRSRAGMLLAAASIAVSLLGRESFSGIRLLPWFAIVCFALLAMCVLAVVWPHADRSVDVDPQALLAGHLSKGDPDAVSIRSDLIAHVMAQHRANERRHAVMSRAFRTGVCLLAIQIVLTLAAATAIV